MKSSVSIPVLAIAFVAAALLAAAKPSHTNVIVIMADDIGLECYGNSGSTYYKTPRIDALAAEGARFTHAYSQPLCTPSRVKIMTGKHSFRNYVTFGTLDLREKTFGNSARDAGYKTCIAGKWQLSPGNAKGPHTVGFDEYCLWHLELDGGKKGNRFKSPVLYHNGKLIKDTEGKYGPEMATDFICDFIGTNAKSPFLVYYPMILVHNPFDPTPDSVDWEQKRSQRKPIERFSDMVTYMDKTIGRIVDKLEAEGLRENTLIMITGDNGTNKDIVSPWHDRKDGIKGAKGSMIDDGTHVAFIANWPGVIKPNTVVEQPIDFSDVFPTICEAISATPPDDLDGQSMLPLLKGDASKARGWAFVDYSRSGISYRHFARTQRYKLYSSGELYDTTKDWMETTPLNSPDFQAVRKKLQAALDQVLTDYPSEEDFRQRLLAYGGEAGRKKADKWDKWDKDGNDGNDGKPKKNKRKNK